MSLILSGNNRKALENVAQDAVKYIKDSKSENTKRAYRTDWEQFSEWCANHGFSSLPAEPTTVVLYLTHLASYLKVTTVVRKMACISEAHKLAGEHNPAHSQEVLALLKGIRRSPEVNRKVEKKRALRLTDLKKVLPLLSNNSIGIRDRAILLIGFTGAFRRSELADLELSDVTFTPSGLTIRIDHSKTDQEAVGMVKTIGQGHNPMTCPIQALREWIEVSGIESGKLFRSVTKGGKIGDRISGYAIAEIVKKVMGLTKINPDEYSGHSLRSGFITEAKEAGISNELIMKQTGHKTASMIAEYYQGGEKELYNITSSIGL